MQVLRDIVENALGVVDSSNVNFSTSRPYQPGTLSVYVDGQLRVATAPDGWSEVSPAAGTFQTTVPPITGSAVQCSYTDVDTRPLVHPLMPLNVSDVQTPMVVRIQLVGGYVVNPVGNGIAELQRNVVSRPYRRPTIVARVMNNDFANRRIQVGYQEHTNEHWVVVIPYSRIRMMEKQIEGTFVSDAVHKLRIPAYVPVLGIY